MQPAAKRMAHANKEDNQPIFKALLFHLTLLFTLSHFSFISLSSKFTVNHVAWSPLLSCWVCVACILSMKAKCAKGMQAVAGSSDRITQFCAKEEVFPNLKQTDLDKSNKYHEMKSVQLEQGLVACHSHIHGWGHFTKVDLPKDMMIVEYVGETVCQCIADKHEKCYKMSGIGSCYNC